MICEYCEHEHPEDQIANPHYCVARLQEDLENARATNDDYYKEFKRLIAAETKRREASNAARDMLADENKAIKADNAVLRKQVKELTVEMDRAIDLHHELLYEVAEKYPNETRHETAKRYLRERGAIRDSTRPASCVIWRLSIWRRKEEENETSVFWP